jgi:hypothetical protein
VGIPGASSVPGDKSRSFLPGTNTCSIMQHMVSSTSSSWRRRDVVETDTASANGAGLPRCDPRGPNGVGHDAVAMGSGSTPVGKAGRYQCPGGVGELRWRRRETYSAPSRVCLACIS